MSAGTAAERLAQIRDVLRGPFPDAWLNDPNMLSLRPVNSATRTMEQMLEDTLSPEEVTAASEVLRECLAIDPEDRVLAKFLLDNTWVEEGGRCSCCYS